MYNYEIKVLERKEKMKNKINLKKHQNGITLIALVVTIIVLLILAGISISMLTGQNGILNRASEAKGKTGISQEEEIVKISVSDALTQGLGVISTDNLKTALTNNGLKGNLLGDGPWTYTGEYKKYNIERNGGITGLNQDESSSNKIVKFVGKYGITESRKLIKLDLSRSEKMWDEVTIKEEVSEVGKVKDSYNNNGSCYIINDEGDVYAWGNNSDGVLGIGNDSDSCIYEPVKINGLTNVEELYFPNSYLFNDDKDGVELPIRIVYAKTSTGMVYSWGANTWRYPALCLGKDISETSIPICWNTVQGLLKDNNVKIESLQCEETYIDGLMTYILTEDDKIYSYSASAPM